MPREHQMCITLIGEIFLEFLRNGCERLLFTRKQAGFRTSASWSIGREEHAPHQKSARLNRSHNAKSNSLCLSSAAIVGCIQGVGDCLIHRAWIGFLRSDSEIAGARVL